MIKLADLVLAAGAALRLTRFVTTDHLGEWLLVGKARAWAGRYEAQARREEYDAKRSAHDGPYPPYSQWGSDHDAEPRTWQGKLVSGLDCPFCVGFWIGGLCLLAAVILPRVPVLGPLWRFAAGALGLNYLVGHVSSRIDG